MGSLIARLVLASCRHAWTVLLVAVLLGIGAGIYAAGHIAIDTDSSKLFSPNLPWRKLEVAYDAAFPQQTGLIAVVVDGATPELAESATASLAKRLGGDPELFPRISRPDGGPFFARNGMLFLSQAAVEKTTRHLIAAQPLLGSLAADPSLRGVMDTLYRRFLRPGDLAFDVGAHVGDRVASFRRLGARVVAVEPQLAEGVVHGDAKLSDVATPFRALADTLQSVLSGKSAPLSWRTLIVGRPPRLRELRHTILVQPKLEFSALQPGARASEAIRQAARDLGLTPEKGVRVRLTGSVPLAAPAATL